LPGGSFHTSRPSLTRIPDHGGVALYDNGDEVLMTISGDIVSIRLKNATCSK
jgi:hypothetical protein